MNTTATLKDWIINSATTATTITNTLFGYPYELNLHQYEYPLFMFEPPDWTTETIRRTGSGIEREYKCHLWFYIYDKNNDIEDVITTLETWAYNTLVSVERNGAFLFRRASNEYDFKFYPTAGSDKVRALEVSVIYTMNTCYNLT